MSITLEMIDNIKKLNNDQIAKIIKVESPWAIENKDLAKKVISSHKNIKKKEEKKNRYVNWSICSPEYS